MFLQKPPFFLHMEGLADPAASYPAEILKLLRMSGELTIWLKRRNVVEKEDLDLEVKTSTAEKNISNLEHSSFREREAESRKCCA